MKFLTIIAILLLISGCSTRNAFEQFNMEKEQELSVSSLLSSKITSQNGEIQGVVSAIYLNEIYPQSYNNNEYFFVYIFLKDKKKMNDPKRFDELSLNLKLNNKTPIKIKQLPHENKFTNLAFMKSDWNKYYLVAFQKDNKSSLNLVLESGQSFSAPLKYQKGE